MYISTILISLDSFEESVKTPFGRVLLFGKIPTTLPVTTATIDPSVIHDDTSLIPTETPTISPITSTIPPTTHTTHYTSSFIYTDSSNDDTPDTPPSPTHEIPLIKVAPHTGQILPTPFGVCRRRVTIISLEQPIPYGRSYHYHSNGSVHMLTVRKRVGPLPTYRLAVKHSVDYSSSDYFTFDDSSRDSPSDSSSEMPSDSSSDSLSDSSSGHSSSNHSSPALQSIMSSPNHYTSDIEDAFSSNSPDYVLASPDFFPTSPGNTSSDSSVNPSRLIPIASPTPSLFHDDPYMKVIMPPKRTSTSKAPAMTQAAIKKLVADSVSATLEAQAANIANTDNTTGPRKTHVARKCTYKEFMKQADKIAWTEFKRLLTNNYCPRTEVKKMEDEFYNLVLKGNDLKTYIRRFQELALLCPNMVPNSKKLIEVFIKGLPRSIKGNVTASKPQTLEKAITIT
nr:reverse transcriptase domain-containing protein [Tanacetum cinerariifolium]